MAEEDESSSSDWREAKRSLIEEHYRVEKENIIMLSQVSTKEKQGEVLVRAAGAAEHQSDPFSHSPCSHYYWKVTAVVYLALCVLLAVTYVAIYAEQHGYYGSYYDNLENLGKPLHSSDSTGQWKKFKDLPYTEWLSRRFVVEGHPLTSWPSLPLPLEDAHQVLGFSLGGSPGVWVVTSNSLLFVEVRQLSGISSGMGGANASSAHSSSEVFLRVHDLGNSLNLSVGVHSRVAVGGDGVVYVVGPSSIAQLNCSVVNRCSVTRQLDSLLLGAVSTALVSGGRVLWVGSDQGLFAARLSPGGLLDPPYRVPQVAGPVLAAAWRGPLVLTHPSHQERGGLAGQDCLRHLRERRPAGTLRCRLQLTGFLANTSCPFLAPNLSTTTGNGYYHGNESLRSILGGLVGQGQDSPWLEGVSQHAGVLAVVAGQRLHFHAGDQWWFEWVATQAAAAGGGLEGPVTSAMFVPSGELYLGTALSLLQVNTDYTFDYIGPQQGLPHHHISSLAFLPHSSLHPHPYQDTNTTNTTAGTVVVTTDVGLALFDVSTSEFVSYFNGYRWLPGNNVSLVTSYSDSGFVVVTNGGWAVIRAELWTLQRKSQHYLSMLSRHTRAPGLVSECRLVNFDPLTCDPAPSNDDGLWTAWLVAAEAFRHQLDGNSSVSWKLFKGLRFLDKVTGVPGLMARSVVNGNQAPDTNGWRDSTTERGWRWKSGASSGEVVGRMFAYPLVYDLVATATDEKEDLVHLIDSIVGYIKRNGYSLPGADGGLPGQWGAWSPEQLNWNQSWAGVRGLHSLQVLAHLVVAYRTTRDPAYLEAWQMLFNGSTAGLGNHYGTNALNQKMAAGSRDFGNDGLAFLTYFSYFYTIKVLERRDPTRARELLGTAPASLERTWRMVEADRSSAWSAIYCYCTNSCSSAVVEGLVWSLRTWPLELIQWPTQNSHRLDLFFVREQARFSPAHSTRVLPANERGQLRWNSDPFQLDSPGSSSEVDPGPWLLPYWLARWARIL